MGSKSTTPGVCALCQGRVFKPKVQAHLATCIPAHGNVDVSRGSTLLRFEAEGEPRYWIIIAASPKATLRHVDAMLRDVWVECCGHMSAFFIGRREIAMRALASEAFAAGAKVRYEYDFGSTTTLVGQYLGSASGVGGRGPVQLLMRNEPLRWSCAECSEPATVVCPYCLDADGLFCAQHAEAHEHAAEEAYSPVVNSPRMGVCGYAG